MGLTRSEAIERVKAIWNLDVDRGAVALYADSLNAGSWLVNVGVNVHRLDANGHPECHARCNDLEADANKLPGVSLVELWAATLNQCTQGNRVSVPKDLAERVTGVVNHFTSQDDRFIYLVMGDNHCWGRGYTERQAFEAASKPKKYLVYACTDPWAFIDGMGDLVRAFESKYWEVKRVEPKKKAGKR